MSRAARRRDHGERLRSARDAGRDRRARRVRRAARGAHRVGAPHPDVMYEYARSAAGRGLRVIIAGAGGAAHLPGMTASMTPLPVIGVPVPLGQLDGLDSLLSIVQMPGGVPGGDRRGRQRQERGPARGAHPRDERRQAARRDGALPGRPRRADPRQGRRDIQERFPELSSFATALFVRDRVEDVELGGAARRQDRREDGRDPAEHHDERELHERG